MGYAEGPTARSAPRRCGAGAPRSTPSTPSAKLRHQRQA